MTEEVFWICRSPRPICCLILLSLCGLGFGIWRIATGPADEVPTLIPHMLWALYNMTILGGAWRWRSESRQVRANPRVEMVMPAAIKLANGHLYPCTVRTTPTAGSASLLETPCPGRQGGSGCCCATVQREQAFAARCSGCSAASWGWSWNPWRRRSTSPSSVRLRPGRHLVPVAAASGQGSPLHNLLDIPLLGWGAYWRLANLAHRLCLYPPRSWLAGCSPSFLVASRPVSGQGLRPLNSERMMKPPRCLIPLLLMAQGRLADGPRALTAKSPRRCAAWR